MEGAPGTFFSSGEVRRDQATLPRAESPKPVERPAYFDVYEFRVEGNSLLDAAAIERAVTPHLGEHKLFADVEAARAALERLYHDAGYLTVLVGVPAQNVDSGVVTIQVTEATVSKLRVMGSQYHSPNDIKEGVSEMAEGKVPNFLEFQRQLSGVNRSQDLRVSPVLKPGKTPGTVEMQLEVDDQLPLHGSVEVTHRADKTLTPTKLNASVRYDNLWQKHHSIGLAVQTTPEDTREVRTLTVNYMLPVGTSGDALSMFSVTSRGQTPRLATNNIGDIDQLGVRYSLALPSDERYGQSATAGLDIKRPKNGPPELDDVRSILYVPFMLSYRGTWLDQGMPVTTLDLGAKWGMRGLMGASDSKFAYFARDSAGEGPQHSASYAAFSGGLQVNHPIGRWQAMAKLEGQVAFAPLLSSEQFFAGGAESVRGYKESEVNGDLGLRGTLELTTPALKLDTKAGPWRLNGIGFVDVAWIKRLQWADAAQAEKSLLGMGLGLRLSGPYGMGLQLDAARAFTDGDVLGGGVQAGEWTWYARWTMEF
jgi:hemolysin activation/secretion protein